MKEQGDKILEEVENFINRVFKENKQDSQEFLYFLDILPLSFSVILRQLVIL